MTFLTPAQVAELLHVSPKTVCGWALTDATMPVTRLPGRLIRFEEGALNRWLLRRAQGRRTAGAGGSQVPEKAAEGA
jgi:excisionase family DNA binding protein